MVNEVVTTKVLKSADIKISDKIAIFKHQDFIESSKSEKDIKNT